MLECLSISVQQLNLEIYANLKKQNGYSSFCGSVQCGSTLSRYFDGEHSKQFTATTLLNECVLCWCACIKYLKHILLYYYIIILLKHWDHHTTEQDIMLTVGRMNELWDSVYLYRDVKINAEWSKMISIYSEEKKINKKKSPTQLINSKTHSLIWMPK